VGAAGCYLFCTDPPLPSATVRARFFGLTPDAEDPATGDAAAALGCLLAAHDAVPAHGTLTVEQGDAAGRPSRLRVHLNGDRVRVGGAAVVTAEGNLLV
jgi:predicted PhzF superfamily epimerase YddE/YHI9